VQENKRKDFLHGKGKNPTLLAQVTGESLKKELVFAKKQPFSSSLSDLSAEVKAQLSLDILLFILLGFPARRSGARGAQ